MAATIQEPEFPAASNYPSPSPYEKQVETAHSRFLSYLSDQSGWSPQGDKNDVRLWRRADQDEPSGLPYVKGETLVKNCTPDAFGLGVVQMPGMRKLWDPRTERGFMMERYCPATVKFYALTKGKKYIASPRDIVGVQRNYTDPDGTLRMIQTSVQDPERAPEQPGTTRADLVLSGWQFKPEGSDLRVTYIFKIRLAGKLPNSIVSYATTETPLCTGRARDAFYKHGFAPYVKNTTRDSSIVFQTEQFDSETKHYKCLLTTGSTTNERFKIVYDQQQMYKKGVLVTINGDAVDAQDDGRGSVAVVTMTPKTNAAVEISPK
ncbi:START domain-containing protein [Sporobolomyces koalae]|uniref:START domain-containing protein n=1 Tax=Sporobolomyces koalae TaxID=500713 RepID=UPI00316B6DDB